MLLYWNRSFFRLIVQRTGSIFLRTDNVIFGLFLAAIAVGVQVLMDRGVEVAPHLPHHYGMHALGVVVAFATVFRTNLGWQRYWESITQLHFMYSKWADAYTQAYSFAQVSIQQTRDKGGEAAGPKIARIRETIKLLERHFSVLSALAADRLSHGDTQRMEKRAEMGFWKKQVVNRTVLRYEDLTGARTLPQFVNVAPARKQSTGSAWEMEYVVKAMPSAREIDALEKSTDRVNMSMYWIVHTITQASKDIDVAPPIQSRMYQELSNGMLGFSNALKIADVPFPLPYAQLLTLLLVHYVIFIPIYVQVFTQSYYAGPILSFLLFQGIWGVNEVAKELENPFGADANDISLADFHARFIDNLEEVNQGHEAIVAQKVEDEQMKQEAIEKKEEKKDVKEPEPAKVGATLAPVVIDVAAESSSKPKVAGSDPSAPPPKPMLAETASEVKIQKLKESPVQNLQPLSFAKEATDMSTTGSATSIPVFDAQLAQINAAMERHLEVIAKEFKTISSIWARGEWSASSALAAVHHHEIIGSDMRPITPQGTCNPLGLSLCAHGGGRNIS